MEDPLGVLEMFLMNIREVGYWVQAVSAALFTYIVLDYQSGDYKNLKKTLSRLFFLIVFFVGLNCLMSLLVMPFRALSGFGPVLAYVLGVVIFGLVFCRYEKNARHLTEALCIFTILVVNEIGSTSGMLLRQFIPQLDISTVRSAADLLLIPAAFVLERNPVWKYYVSRPARRYGSICFITSQLILVVYYLFRINVFGPEEPWASQALMLSVMVALYFINTVSYLGVYRMCREYTYTLNLEAVTQMDKSAESLLSVTESNLAELHKIKHDIQNQYGYMQAMLAEKDYKSLENYFAELTGTFAEPLVPFVDCGNHALDLIFNMENAKAQDAGVKLDIKAAPPHTLPISELDLCKLYTNVIDNAIEACVAEKTENAVVKIDVNVAGEYLFTRIANPTSKTTSFLEKGLPTTKQDGRLHGKGMSIVRDIVKKNNGILKVKIEEGVYYVEFLLALPEKIPDGGR